MLKNKAYWQAYNQKRKDYLTLKKRESRAKLKAQSTTLLTQNLVFTTIPEKVVDIQAVVDHQVVDRASKVVDNNRSPVVDRQEVVDNKPKRVVDRVVDSSVVDREVVDHNSKLVVDHPILRLLQSWKAGTNYNCATTCLYSYCSNCWYFEQDELVDYKEVSM